MDPGQDKHQQGDHPEVSEDKGEESHRTSPPITVSSTTSSSEDKVGNKSTSSSSTSSSSTSRSSGSGTSSSSGSGTSSSSGSGTSRSSGSRTSRSSGSSTSRSSGSRTSSSSGSSTSSSSSSYSCTSSSSEDEVGNDCTTSSSPTVDRSYAVLELLEVLPPKFKYTWDIGMAQQPQEPILRLQDSRQIGTSQPYQVGLEEDAGHVMTGMNRKRTKASDAEEESPTKKTRHSVGEEDPVLSSPVTSPSQYMVHEDSVWSHPFLSPLCILAHEDLDWSSPEISPSQYIMHEEPFLSSTVLCPSPLDLILEDPILPPSVFSSSPIPYEEHLLLFPAISPPQRLGLEEEPGHVTSVTCRKRTKGSDAEEEPPGKKTRHSVAEEFPILSSPVIGPSQYILPEDPFLSPTVSTVFSPSPLEPIFEDLILPACVFSPSPTLAFEDPILSFPVLGLSPSAHGNDSSLSSPEDCIWVESEEDTEEEPIPSTAGIGPDGIRVRESFRQAWFRPHYDLSSDSD
ncbi:uncharacterized protein LOC114142502 [Xiphophorus couchianus]|uniref:uncharacterized protein LOC114142502 n=1 Tax=Xiphophorus couchianus TaxID=32473 RepID=UPI001016A9F3|nr:uncharacterized protein LOC114142502 [Xiphophorus couchianus]